MHYHVKLQTGFQQNPVLKWKFWPFKDHYCLSNDSHLEWKTDLEKESFSNLVCFIVLQCLATFLYKYIFCLDILNLHHI